MENRNFYGAGILFDDVPTVLGPNFSPVMELVGGEMTLNGWTLGASGILTPGAGDTLDISLQHSVDGLTFTSALALPQLTAAAPSNRATITGGPFNFLRVSITEAGSGTWTNLKVAVLGTGVRVIPVFPA